MACLFLQSTRYPERGGKKKVGKVVWVISIMQNREDEFAVHTF